MDQDKQVSKKKPELQITLSTIIVNFIILFAINDLYFSSSIENGVKSVEAPSDAPPAKRLVLFLVDGLGIDLLFGLNSYKSLFLSNIIHAEGSWGIAHSRFPTLARSGHMAILTGTYEDPITAVFGDWTTRPVYTDSLIRQSKHTWYWGSRQILNQFNPENLAHVHSSTYPSKNHNINNGNNWIVRDTKSFLSQNKYRIGLKSSIFNEHGTLFLIHLPLSGNNDIAVRNLDKEIEAISGIFARAFADYSTAFTMTSAYGMTNWGSHGGDSNQEIQTPFIAWGAGIKRNVTNHSLSQIDIAPLLACLIGVSIPVDSLGVVPLDFLDLPKEHFVSEQATNALQISNVFDAKRKRIKSHSLLFYPYKDLNAATLVDTFAHLKYLHLRGNYATLIDDCKNLIDKLLKGIGYYETYHNTYLIVCIVSGYLLWIIYLVSQVFNDDDAISHCCFYPVGLLVLIPIYFSYIQSWPISYYIYSSFPFIMFSLAVPCLESIISKFSWSLTQRICYYVIIIILPVQLLLILSVFCRYVVSLALVFICVYIFIQDSYGKSISNKGKMIWSSLCIVLSIFSAHPRLVLTICSLPFLIYGGCIWVYLFSRSLKKLQFDADRLNFSVRVFAFQQTCFIFAALYRIVIYFGGNRRVLVPWILSLVPLLPVPFIANNILLRLAGIVFGTLPFYFLTSSSDELVFLAIYVVSLLYWWIIETNSGEDFGDISVFSFDDAIQDKIQLSRRLLMAAVFLLTGFYGGGNIFSVNSYSPLWTQPLVTYSNPIIDALLIILKISVPIFICVSVLNAINITTKEHSFKMINSLLIAFDITIFKMFLLLVFYRGSWLNISLSHLTVITGFKLVILLSYNFADAISTFSFLHCIQKSMFLNKLLF